MYEYKIIERMGEGYVGSLANEDVELIEKENWGDYIFSSRF